jgi:membrane protease YdiL (CAAX protease family)
MKKSVDRKKTETGWSYIFLALYAFGGLGTEAIYAFGLEPFIYGASMEDWNAMQNIIHWVITCITWGIITVGLIKSSKKKYGFDLLASRPKIKMWQWISVLLCVAFSLVMSYMDWNGFKVVKEFQSKGLLLFIFQYIYYVFETALFTLIIIFAQKAFEVWFKKENFPFGGIILALTWGLAHIFTKGSIQVGLLTALGGFIYGIAYLLLNRDIKKTLPILFIMFML